MTAKIWAPEAVVDSNDQGTQRLPEVTVLKDGSYVIAWFVTETRAVHAQKFDAGGSPQGSRLDLATLPGTDNPRIDLDATGDGGFIVSWAAAALLDGARFDAAGGRVQDYGTVALPTSDQPSTISVGQGTDRVDVVARILNPATSQDIYLVRYDSAGNPLASVQVNTSVNNSQSDPQIIELIDGRYVVAWSSKVGASTEVRARIFAADGAPLGSDFQVNTNQASDTPVPKLAALNDGGFAIAWESAGAFGDDVAGRIYNPGGLAATSEFSINSDWQSQEAVQLVPLLAGGLAAFWVDKLTNTIRGQLLDAAGARIGASFTVSTDTDFEGFGANLSAAALHDGRIVLTWSARGNGGDPRDVSSVIIDPRNGQIEGRAAADLLYGSTAADQVTAQGGADTVHAGEGMDSVYGGGANDWLFGEDGDDRLYGQSGNDLLVGGEGRDALAGGFGDDSLSGGAGIDTLNGGDGFDWAIYNQSSTAIKLNLDTGVHTGEAVGDVFISVERFFLTSFNDTFIGSSAGEGVAGSDGVDTLQGGGGDDILSGGDGADRLDGGTQADYLGGDEGADQLFGGTEADTLEGGGGADRLTGGAGADVFVWKALTDSGPGAASDRVLDFNRAQGDKFDLSVLDAVAGGADDAFTLVASFTGVAGQLVAKQNGAKTLTTIEGDVNGDGAADFSIAVAGPTVLAAGDFVL